LVTFETLCWNRKHVLYNLGSLTGVHSHFYRCPKKVAVTFGCTQLSVVTKSRPQARTREIMKIRILYE
jgi:hypothetical protein